MGRHPAPRKKIWAKSLGTIESHPARRLMGIDESDIPVNHIQIGIFVERFRYLPQDVGRCERII